MSTLVAATSLTMVIGPRTAAASQISDLQAQAASISQKLVQEQLQIGAEQQQYSVASEKVAADNRAITATAQQLSQDQQQIAVDTSAVRQLAIKSYMNGGKLSGSGTALFTGNAEQAQLVNEYAAIAAGGMESALDQLQTAQLTLQAHEETLQQQQDQDRSEQEQQAADLAQAQSTEHQMEAVQRQVTGQLAAAVAAQTTAQATAAAAAVAAATRSAPQTAVNGTTSTPASGADPALNPYLQCVVRAESGGNYAAVSPNGMYMGAFQFSQATWNSAARAAGRPDLVGVPPNRASKADQDTVAVALYALDGQQPWLGDRCSS